MFNNDRIIIAGMILVAIVLALAFIFGIPIRSGYFDIGPERTDVVNVKDTAQLIRQDASQRAILLMPKSGGIPSYSACSEPPPDIAQNIVQSLNSSLEMLGKQENIEASIAAKITNDLKTAAQLLFQRSQGIQLLRDTMFRLCEGFQNNVLTSDDYRMLIQELIKTANFIIPFEQCTGMAKGNDDTNPKMLEAITNRCLETAMVFNQRLTDPSASVSPLGRMLVIEVQRALSVQGYSPGPVDGIPGRRTRDAVRRYEQAMGLPATGIIDSTLYHTLYNHIAKLGASENDRSTNKSSASADPRADLP